MVASSVVSTILILNYHHRNSDTHEMSEWVSVFFHVGKTFVNFSFFKVFKISIVFNHKTQNTFLLPKNKNTEMQIHSCVGGNVLSQMDLPYNS